MKNYIETIYGDIMSNIDTFSQKFSLFYWLSGNDLLTKNFKYYAMNLIKRNYIKINLENMTLSIVYHTFLQWNLNKETVMIFHKNILYVIECSFHYFYYKQINYILYFLNTLNYNYNVLNNLNNLYNLLRFLIYRIIVVIDPRVTYTCFDIIYNLK